MNTWKLSSSDLFSLGLTIKGAWIYEIMPEVGKLKEALAHIAATYPYLTGRYNPQTKAMEWDENAVGTIPFEEIDGTGHSMADELGKRVVVVDTSNEIAGDGDTPHPAIGSARRMQVAQPEYQKDIMIEAVENHTPEVIVVDEIGTEAEAQAARTIAERGVMLIATAHGNSLESLIKNPTLSDLVGGIQSVTLGDDEARRRSSQKTVLEREKQPTFDIVIEIIDRNTLSTRAWPRNPHRRPLSLQEWPILKDGTRVPRKCRK